MRSDWKEVRLEDITTKLGDGLHGTPKYDDKGEYYFINGNNIGNGKITITENTKRVNYNEYIKLKKDLNDRTVFVSINGTLGNVGLYNGEKVCLGKSACYFNVEDKTDKHFVKYIMSSRIFQHYINVYATGTTIKNMGLKAMRNFSFYLPPLPTQKKIAHILSTLDDKIELNRKMNQTLEAMAQALFKSWFVDFDPVHLKARCQSEEELEAGAKELGIAKEILELFPSEFVESEMGMIPLGWEVKPISEVSSVAIGKTPPRKEPQWFTTNTDDIKWISIRDMGNNGMYTIETSEYLTKKAIEKFNVKVIPSHTVLFSFKLTLGRVSITTEAMTSNEAIAHFVLDDSSVLSTEYIYCYLKNFDYSMLGSTSSIATAINSKIVKTIPTIVATETTINMFNSMVNPIFKQILGLTKEIQALENTRDALLPKLLSGELDVSKLKIAEEN